MKNYDVWRVGRWRGVRSADDLGDGSGARGLVAGVAGQGTALDRLTVEDALAGEIVRLRYFAGLTWPEIAELTGMSERDLNRQWAFARAWLRDAMGK